MRTGQLVSQISVIGHDQHAGRIEIQPPYGINSLADIRHQIEYRRPSLFVLRGSDVSRRFIQNIIDKPFFRGDRPTCDRDHIPLCYIVSALSLQTVDRHLSLLNQLVGLSPGTDPAVCDIFIETHNFPFCANPQIFSKTRLYRNSVIFRPIFSLRSLSENPAESLYKNSEKKTGPFFQNRRKCRSCGDSRSSSESFYHKREQKRRKMSPNMFKMTI